MRTRIACSLLAVLSLTGLAGCGSSSTSTSSDGGPVTTPAAGDALAGSSWTLESYQGPSQDTVPAATGAVSTLAFAADGMFSGSTGCNRLSGTYSVTGEQLSIEVGPMTRMACTDPDVQAQETAVVQQLAEVTGFTVANEHLTLTGDDGTTRLTYAAGLSGLEGTAWQVTGVNTGTAVESSALTEKLTATFGAAGAFNAFGGCNTMAGMYETTGTAGLTISGLASTMMGCGADVSTLEGQYSAALGQVTTYEISGEQLTLRNADGATQVTATLAG